MSCRLVSWLNCLCVALAAATDVSGQHSATEPTTLDPGAVLDVGRTTLATLTAMAATYTSPALSGSPAAGGGGSSAAPATHPHNGSRQLPAHYACPAPPPDDEAVDRLRCLSGEEKGWRLLEAAKAGQVEKIQRLLMAGADVGASDWFGMTALHWIIGDGRVRPVMCLLEGGAMVDASTNLLRIAPLHAALLKGDKDVVRLLLAFSANPNARTDGGLTPLHLAAATEDMEYATLLLGHGADVNASTTWLQFTPLHVASLFGRAATVRLLVAYSADPNARTDGGLTPLHLVTARGDAAVEAAAALLQAGADRWATNDDGRTPLDFARRENQQQMMAMLSEPAAGDNGTAPATQPDSERSHAPSATAAQPAADCPTDPPPEDDAVCRLRSLPEEEKGFRLIKAAKEGTVEEMQRLLAAGANVGARDLVWGTALHFAAANGHPDAVRCLLEAGAMVNATTTFLRLTTLHVAPLSGNAAVLQLLLAASANPNAKTAEGLTPLHLAAGSEHVEVAAVLLEHGADVNATHTWQQFTPLHVAALFGRAALMRLLLSSSADPNARTDSGLTPLHLVAALGYEEAATVLLEAGANRWPRTDDGRTPLHFAKQENKEQLINMLSVPAAGDNTTSPTIQPHGNHSDYCLALLTATTSVTASPSTTTEEDLSQVRDAISTFKRTMFVRVTNLG